MVVVVVATVTQLPATFSRNRTVAPYCLGESTPENVYSLGLTSVDGHFDTLTFRSGLTIAPVGSTVAVDADAEAR